MLTAGRPVEEREGRKFAYPPPAGGFTGFQGSLAMLNAGVLEPAAQQATAAAAAACAVVGVVEKIPPLDTSDVQPNIPVVHGTFLFLNSSGADAISLANVGQPAFAVDDETVALTSDTNLRPQAGIIADVESDGVWVKVGF